MIDIYSAERFVAAGGADPASRDVHGVLWTRTWTHRGTEIDKWCAVELRGDQGSAPAAFHAVPPRLRSPAEALAWLRRQPGRIG